VRAGIEIPEKTMTRAHIAAFTLLAVIGTAAGAQETARVAVAPDSKLWIDGTSNLHGWTCKAEKLTATIDFDAANAAVVGSAPTKSMKRVEVKVPVKSLKCGHGAMDDNLYKALGADDSSQISYILATFEAAPGETKTNFTLHTIGTLTVAGKTNDVTMDVNATRLADGTVKATGTLPIKMTDYGIKPPTAMFGTLKTGNEIKVSFELTVGSAAIATALREP
jgi:polyisoprenoid-binding protein YceI